MSKSIKVETNINHPFDWMEEQAWTWMSDLCNEYLYTYMDDIQRVIQKDITLEDFIGYGHEEIPEDFKKEYSKNFPNMIAECLEGLAECIRNKEIEFEIDFNE